MRHLGKEMFGVVTQACGRRVKLDGGDAGHQTPVMFLGRSGGFRTRRQAAAASRRLKPFVRRRPQHSPQRAALSPWMRAEISGTA